MFFHPDIEAFLSTKKENADEKVRVKTLSLGVTYLIKFYESQLTLNREGVQPALMLNVITVTISMLNITWKNMMNW